MALKLNLTSESPKTPVACAAARLALLAGLLAGFAGCASPGPPRAPSLQVPSLVTDLTASRHGAVVTLRFTLPKRATDGTPLRSTTLTASVCRAVEQGACVPLATLPPQPIAEAVDEAAAIATIVSWDDVLDVSLNNGAARLLTYRVELRNRWVGDRVGEAGRSAGYSEAAYAAGGASPATVEGLRAQGSRLGIVLAWKPVADESAEIVLRREDLRHKETSAAGKAQHQRHTSADASGVVWLRTSTVEPGETPDLSAAKNSTLDTTAILETPYRYSAERRRSVTLGGRTLEIRSAASLTVLFTLHAVYPPPAPTDLNGTSFAAEAPEAGVLVDLIWQPVDDPDLAGYNVYREGLAADGHADARRRLNESPISLPGFRDHLAAVAGSQRFRYTVTAVNKKGLEGAAAAVALVVSEP